MSHMNNHGIPEIYEQFQFFSEQMNTQQDIHSLYELSLNFLSKLLSLKNSVAESCLFVTDPSGFDFLPSYFSDSVQNKGVFDIELNYQVDSDMIAWVLQNKKDLFTHSSSENNFSNTVIIPLEYHNETTALIMVLTQHNEESLSRATRQVIKMTCLQTVVFADKILLYEQTLNHNTILEKEVKRQTQNLLESNKQLLELNEKNVHLMKEAQASNRAKSYFLATMSHELRTPLNSVLGLTELLLDSATDEDQRDSLNAINQAGNSLLFIINDILDFIKIEEGEIEIERCPVSMKNLKTTLEQIFTRKYQTKGINFSYDIKPNVPLWFTGDELRVSQILINLLDNALKFTDKGGVEVVVSHKEKIIQFTISDTGIGIPVNKQKIIFDLFAQVDGSMSRKFGGTGLGLTICKQLTALMNGELTCKSNTPKGTTFIFTFPYEMAQVHYNTPEKPTNQSNTEDTANTTILIVEDNKFNQKVAIKMLSKLQYNYLLSENGLEAIQLIKKHYNEIDLILMDCQMPLMDGYEATEKIRLYECEKNLPPIPIVALTANTLPEDRQRCKKSGMNDFISKPVSRKVLEQKITLNLKK